MRKRETNDAYGDSEREYGSGITDCVDDLVRGDVVHFYHLVEASGEKASDVGVKGEGCDRLLMVGQGTDAATAGIEIPDAQDGAGGGQCDGAGRKNGDLFDRGCARGSGTHEELTLAGTRIEEPGSCVIRAGEDKVGV